MLETLRFTRSISSYKKARTVSDQNILRKYRKNTPNPYTHNEYEGQHFCQEGLPQVQEEERHGHFRAVAEVLKAGVVEESVRHEEQEQVQSAEGAF